MMGTVELSETEMLEMRYNRPLGLTREPFMYHWTWSGGGLGDITCTVRVVPPSLFTTTTDCLIGTGTTSEEDRKCMRAYLYDNYSYNQRFEDTHHLLQI